MICAFCDNNEIEERLICDNNLVNVFPSNQPITIGHILIVPKRCIATFEEMTSEEQKAIFDMIKIMKKALKVTFGCEGFNFAWNEDKVAGQTVAHFHLHIVPRKKGDEGVYNYEPREFLYRPGTRAITPQQELKEIATIIKNSI